MAVGDMDGDGYTDIILSGYSANKLFVFTYKPEWNSQVDLMWNNLIRCFKKL